MSDYRDRDYGCCGRRYDDRRGDRPRGVGPGRYDRGRGPGRYDRDRDRYDRWDKDDDCRGDWSRRYPGGAPCPYSTPRAWQNPRYRRYDR